MPRPSPPGGRPGRRPRRLGLLLAVALLAGCGGGSSNRTQTSTQTLPVQSPAAAMRRLITAEPQLAGTVRTLYVSSSWAVVQSTAAGQAHAVAFHLVGGRWRPDRSGRVKIEILGPRPGATAPRLPQVAIQFAAATPFVESSIWVDGSGLNVQGGGSPTRGTIYGAPAAKLKPGDHVAVGYARTRTTGTAVAWVFKTP
jgi:hypothetical protein